MSGTDITDETCESENPGPNVHPFWVDTVRQQLEEQLRRIRPSNHADDRFQVIVDAHIRAHESSDEELLALRENARRTMVLHPDAEAQVRAYLREGVYDRDIIRRKAAIR